MFGIDARAARATWTVFLVALLIATTYAIRQTVVVLACALLFAYLLMPVLELVERYSPRQVKTTLALAIVYLGLLGALIGAGFAIGGRIADEASMLGDRLPGLLQNREWIDRIPLPYWLEPDRQRIVAAIQDQFANGGKDFLPYLKNFGGQILSSFKYILD